MFNHVTSTWLLIICLLPLMANVTDAVLKLGCVNVNGLFELKPLHISQSSRNSERRDDAIKSLLLDMDRGNSFVHTTGTVCL